MCTKTVYGVALETHAYTAEMGAEAADEAASGTQSATDQAGLLRPRRGKIRMVHGDGAHREHGMVVKKKK